MFKYICVPICNTHDNNNIDAQDYRITVYIITNYISYTCDQNLVKRPRKRSLIFQNSL